MKITSLIRSQNECFFPLCDSASTHKSKQVTEYLGDKGLRLLPNGPYSPDLASHSLGINLFVDRKMLEKMFHHCLDKQKSSILSADRYPLLSTAVALTCGSKTDTQVEMVKR